MRFVEYQPVLSNEFFSVGYDFLQGFRSLSFEDFILENIAEYEIVYDSQTFGNYLPGFFVFGIDFGQFLSFHHQLFNLSCQLPLLMLL